MIELILRLATPLDPTSMLNKFISTNTAFAFCPNLCARSRHFIMNFQPIALQLYWLCALAIILAENGQDL